MSHCATRVFNWIVSLLPILFISCQKSDLINDYPSRISFEVSGRLLEGKKINCIAIDSKGGSYVGSGKTIYYTRGSYQKEYVTDFEVHDLALSSDNTVWIGSNGGGLGHLTENGIRWYNSENSGFPRDFVGNVEIAPDGNVWFTCCAFRIGGLGIFNGKKFEFLTPENSPLNQNLIDDIEIDKDGVVYICTSGTVGYTNIYRIANKSWQCLGDEKGTFYWVFSFSLSPAGNIFVIEDFALSSAMQNNRLYEFTGIKWEEISTGDMNMSRFFSKVKSDKRGYCWISDHNGPFTKLHVYNGKSWVSSQEDIFPADIITTIETDNENNIWIGTYENGIIILNQ